MFLGPTYSKIFFAGLRPAPQPWPAPRSQKAVHTRAFTDSHSTLTAHGARMCTCAPQDTSVKPQTPTTTVRPLFTRQNSEGDLWGGTVIRSSCFRAHDIASPPAQNAENEICHRHTHQLDTDTQCYTHMINNNAHAHDSPFGVAMILATESP